MQTTLVELSAWRRLVAADIGDLQPSVLLTDQKGSSVRSRPCAVSRECHIQQPSGQREDHHREQEAALASAACLGHWLDHHDPARASTHRSEPSRQAFASNQHESKCHYLFLADSLHHSLRTDTEHFGLKCGREDWRLPTTLLRLPSPARRIRKRTHALLDQVVFPKIRLSLPTSGERRKLDSTLVAAKHEYTFPDECQRLR